MGYLSTILYINPSVLLRVVSPDCWNILVFFKILKGWDQKMRKPVSMAEINNNSRPWVGMDGSIDTWLVVLADHKIGGKTTSSRMGTSNINRLKPPRYSSHRAGFVISPGAMVISANEICIGIWQGPPPEFSVPPLPNDLYNSSWVYAIFDLRCY